MLTKENISALARSLEEDDEMSICYHSQHVGIEGFMF